MPSSVYRDGEHVPEATVLMIVLRLGMVYGGDLERSSGNGTDVFPWVRR